MASNAPKLMARQRLGAARTRPNPASVTQRLTAVLPGVRGARPAPAAPVSPGGANGATPAAGSPWQGPNPNAPPRPIFTGSLPPNLAAAVSNGQMDFATAHDRAMQNRPGYRQRVEAGIAAGRAIDPSYGQGTPQEQGQEQPAPAPAPTSTATPRAPAWQTLRAAGMQGTGSAAGNRAAVARLQGGAPGPTVSTMPPDAGSAGTGMTGATVRQDPGYWTPEQMAQARPYSAREMDPGLLARIQANQANARNQGYPVSDPTNAQAAGGSIESALANLRSQLGIGGSSALQTQEKPLPDSPLGALTSINGGGLQGGGEEFGGPPTRGVMPFLRGGIPRGGSTPDLGGGANPYLALLQGRLGGVR